MITFYFLSGKWVFSPYLYSQIFVVSALLLKGSPRRKNFLFRYLLALLGMILIALFLPAWINNDNKIVNILYESVGLCVGTLGYAGLFLIPYDVKWYKSVFAVCLGYNIQHTIFAFFDLLPKEFSMVTPWSELLQICICTVLGLLLSKAVEKLFSIPKLPSSLVLVLISTFLVNVLLSVMNDKIGDEYATLIIRLETIVHCISIIFFSVIVSNSIRDQSRNEMVKLKLESSKSDFNSAKYDFEQLRIRNHDLKHFIHDFEGKLSDEDLARIDAMIDQNDIYYTEMNSPLDYVLMKKREICLRNKIEFTFNGNSNIVSFMKEGHAYALFENLIDNAIEAASKIQDQDKRVISLNISKEKETVIIECSNYYQGKLNEKNGSLRTTKKHSEYHGLGISSIKRIVAKYGGTYHSEYGDGKFHTFITLKETPNI